jgi:hypothetical protein
MNNEDKRDLSRDGTRDNMRDKIRDDARDSERDCSRDNNKIHEDEFFNLKEELHVFTTSQRLMCENHIDKMDETINEFKTYKATLDSHTLILAQHTYDLNIGKWVLTTVAGVVIFLASIGVYQWMHLGNSVLNKVDNDNHAAITTTVIK